MPFIVSVCGVICTLFTLYFAFTSVGGVLFRKPEKVPRRPAQKRIAAVIPARNEVAVIGKLVESLLAQDYPRELFDIYVLPNNCRDETERAALRAGARILRDRGLRRLLRVRRGQPGLPGLLPVRQRHAAGGLSRGPGLPGQQEPL